MPAVVHLRRAVMRLLLVMPALAIVLLVPLVTASAQEPYPPRTVHVTAGRVSEAIIERGESTHLRAEGYAGGAAVRVEVQGGLVEVVRADPAGRIDVPVAVQALGDQLLSASGPEPGGSLRVASAAVRVLRPGSRSLSEGPSRSEDVLPGLGLGLGIVVAGTIGTHVVRLTRRPSSGRL